MRTNRRSPVLVELIIVICFFSLALSVVVRLFAEVHVQNKDIAKENNAMVLMQDQAELLKADPLSGISGTAYYNEDFTAVVQGESAQYIELTVEITEYGAGTLYNFTFVAYAVDETGEIGEVARLSAARYVPSTGGGADE